MSAEVKKEIQLEIGHVLFMDIVGYSKRLINEQRALRQTLNQIVRETEQFRTADASGSLIKSPTGDGMALIFHGSPEEPVECALEISRALKTHPELPLRMGVHSGPVSGVIDVNDQTSVAGAGINMAQRVMDCGDGGHILLSKHVAEDLEQYAHWKPHLHDLGECEVKHGVRVHIVNLYTEELANPEPPEKFKHLRGKKKTSPAIPGSTAKAIRPSWPLILAAILISAAVVGGILMFRGVETGHRTVQANSPDDRGRPSGASLPISEKTIAVLPFENLSRDPDNAYFATGIQDEILTRLAKIGSLKVISRTSTQQYAARPANLTEIGRQLNVANILEGSVQKAANQVHINAQLIRAATDEHLWADTYDRTLDNIFGVEAEVAASVAEALKTKLTGAEQHALAEKPTDNPQAYDAYLRGLAYSLKPANTPANASAAQKYLKEAVRLDPKFALCWALLAYVDARGYGSTSLQPTIALREEARQAAETALTLKPNLGEAVLGKGYYHYRCLKDYDTAVRYFEQARPLLPNSSQIPEALAYVTRRQGKWDRSEAYFNEAERLDPRNVRLLTQHALSYISFRRFPEARRKLDQVLDITPDDLNTLVNKAGIAQSEGDLPRASALLAPLHPAADDTNALETQVYQAILERRPAVMIARLQEILAKPNPAFGYMNGELRFWLGWAQEVGGDHAAAQESWRQARSELESFLKEQPENNSLMGDLALTDAGLGDKAGALAMAEQAITANPIEKDAWTGPGMIEILARVAAQVGEPDRAIAALQKLLAIPYEGAIAANTLFTPALLQFDPMLDPLRNDPRFQKLVASSTPKP
jgi:TolB-like protein/class 3 adenylate cyclase/predicted Zn-dependent protease